MIGQPSVPQTKLGVVIDGSASGGVPVTPQPFTSERLAYFSVNAPASPFVGTIFTDAALGTALVDLLWFLPAGTSFIVYDGPAGNPSLSTIMWGLNGDTAPGFGFARLNANIKVGPDCWVLASGLTATFTFAATYTGSQQ